MEDQKPVVMIPANKKADYQIKESEGKFYHLHVVEEVPTADESKKFVTERVIQMSPRDFQTYLKFKKLFTWKEETIWHDPTLPMAQNAEVKEDGDAGVAEVKEDEPIAEAKPEPRRFGRPAKKS